MNIKIILLLLSVQILAGCVDRHENTGLEIQNKIIKVPTNVPTNLLDLDLYSFDSILYENYPNRIIIQAPENINGWSIMSPEVVNIMYETDIHKNIGLGIKNVVDTEDTDYDTLLPISTNPSIDQYADDSNSNIDSNIDSENNPGYSFDE